MINGYETEQLWYYALTFGYLLIMGGWCLYFIYPAFFKSSKRRK